MGRIFFLLEGREGSSEIRGGGFPESWEVYTGGGQEAEFAVRKWGGGLPSQLGGREGREMCFQ